MGVETEIRYTECIVPFIYYSIYIYPYPYLSICLSIYLSIYLSNPFFPFTSNFDWENDEFPSGLNNGYVALPDGVFQITSAVTTSFIIHENVNLWIL